MNCLVKIDLLFLIRFKVCFGDGIERVLCGSSSNSFDLDPFRSCFLRRPLIIIAVPMNSRESVRSDILHFRLHTSSMHWVITERDVSIILDFD